MSCLYRPSSSTRLRNLGLSGFQGDVCPCTGRWPSRLLGNMVGLLPLVVWFSSFSFKSCGQACCLPQLCYHARKLRIVNNCHWISSDRDSRRNRSVDSTVGWVKARQTLPSQVMIAFWAWSLGSPSPHLFSSVSTRPLVSSALWSLIWGQNTEKGHIRPLRSLRTRFSPISWINAFWDCYKSDYFPEFWKKLFLTPFANVLIKLWRNGFTEIFTLPSLLIYDLLIFVCKCIQYNE